MASAVTPDGLVEKLKALGCSFKEYEHEALMTCDDMVKAGLPSDGVSICKNIFLKDKKHRLILVTALHDTKVDMKVLSSRLGLGKSGVRLAPDEMLTAVLQVPLGSVTPLALVQESASKVVLLVDQKVKSATTLGLHPLINTKTLALTPADLETFLSSIGRSVPYVDLEAEPMINADNPPDLKQYIDNAEPYAEAAETPLAESDTPAGVQKPKKDKKGGKVTPSTAQPQPPKNHSNVSILVQECITTVMAALQIDDMSPEKKRAVELDLAAKITSLKNSAYSNGFKAARGAVADYCK